MNDLSKLNLILMADDDPDDQLLVKDALAESGWQGDFQAVADGEQLLCYLRQQGDFQSAPRPQLILLDLNMPRKSGREALQEIRTDPALRRIPVVVLTTSRAETDIDALYELGANSFVSKPVQFDSLVEVLRTLCQFWFNTAVLPEQKPAP